MCGITFRKIETLKNMLETQSSRGMDGIGLVYQGQKGIKIHKVFVQKDYKHWMEWKTGEEEAQQFFFVDDRVYSYPKLEQFYQDILELTTRNMDKDKFIFAHHRKGTVGSNGINNTHPFETDKFILAQNGTDRRIHEWGIVEGIDPDRSDTYVLLKYLDLHCNTLKECLDRIQILIARKIVIGTIMIYSKQEEKIMFFADGERSLYVEKNAEGGIEYIQSRKDNSELDYKTQGYIVIDFTGKVHVENLTSLNEPKIVHKPVTQQVYYNNKTGTYQNQLPTTQGAYSMYGDDYYENFNWGDFEGGFQDINPDVTDVNAIEDENGWINQLGLADVMEYIEDLDEKKFRILKSKIESHIASQVDSDEYVNIIVYAGMLIKRGITLAETQINAISKAQKGFMDLGKENIHTKEREKSLQKLQMTLMELNAYKDIYRL